MHKRWSSSELILPAMALILPALPSLQILYMMDETNGPDPTQP